MRVVTRKPSEQRCPKNPAEREFFLEYSAQGWELSKRGWPDFICYRDLEVMAVEIKPRVTDPLKFNQHKVLKTLSSHGLSSYLWTPANGLEEV